MAEALRPASETPPTLSLVVPIPPSANRIWRSVPGLRRPVRSDEYSAWARTAGWEAKMQLVGAPRIIGRFNARIEVPAKSQRDRDNWTKPLFDLCQSVGAIGNDRGLVEYTVVGADRSDCLILLWDLGGDPLPEPKKRKPSAGPRSSRNAVRDRKATELFVKYLPR